ncbi:hypothetical protein BSA16_07635 [Micromonospora sp. Rc5]|nr:hypothetical protein BSA16_07635 [Micromonospora sp. Rc5]
MDTAYEHHRWRHCVRYARPRPDLSVYDVPLIFGEGEDPSPTTPGPPDERARHSAVCYREPGGLPSCPHLFGQYRSCSVTRAVSVTTASRISFTSRLSGSVGLPFVSAPIMSVPARAVTVRCAATSALR